jgi:AAA family ATP:ADP antiporter
MKNAILKAFNIRKGEETAISLLLLYSFFMGSVIAFFYTSATSLFVVSFDSGVLPFAYIGGGIMSYLVWLIYVRVERAISFPNLVLSGIVLLLLSVGFFVVGNQYFNSKWLTFLMFVWIRVFVFISVVGFWGLATKMFDLRQGKRIFGLISSGEVISDIVGFFSIPLVLRFIDTSHLLYISLFGLVICLTLMLYILKHFEKPLSIQDTKPEKKMDTSFKFMLKDKYLTLLILMAVLPMFGMCFADFSFLHQVKIEFGDQALLASFLSIFFGVTAVAEFILKSFFSGRLLNKYGLKVALPVLPVLLAGCVFLAISAGVLYGATGLFFSFIAFTKMIDRVLRSAIYDPSYQILYQPLRAEDRLKAQGMVEGMAKGLGFALAGAVVLLFTRFSFLSLVHVNILFFLILAVWVKLSLNMYQAYRSSLRKILTSNDITESDSVNYKSNSVVLSKVIEKDKEPNFSLLMNIMDHVEPQNVHRFLQRILVSSSVKQHEKILLQIQNKQILSAEQIIRNHLISNPHLPNKELFERTLASLQEARKVDFETLSQLSQSEDSKKRMLAANLLSHSGSYKTYKILLALLQDEDPETRKAALISSGQFGRRELWPQIIRNLSEDAYSRTAIAAIKMIGEPIMNELDSFFDKNNTTKEVKLKIIAIYAGIKGEKAVNLLRSRIQYPDETIRKQVFKALSKMEYHAKPLELSLIKETIDEEIAVTVWVMAALLDIQKEKDMLLLKEALQYELVQKKENVFLLLSMLYDSKTIRYIQESFQTGTHEARVYATEILDLTVSAEIKEIFLPLLDDLSLEDSLRLFRDKYPQQKMSVFERLNDIINKDYLKINRWTKACAIILLENYHENEKILLSTFLNPDPFIMQNSAILLKKQNSDRFKSILEKLDKDKVSEINKYTLLPEKGLPVFLLSDKVNFVKRNRLFNAFSNPDIARIIENSTEIKLSKGEKVNIGEMAKDSVFFVLYGTVSVLTNNQIISNLNENEFYWGIVNDSEDKIILKGENNSTLLVISPELIFNSMSENSDYTQEVIGFLSKTAS